MEREKGKREMRVRGRGDRGNEEKEGRGRREILIISSVSSNWEIEHYLKF